MMINMIQVTGATAATRPVLCFRPQDGETPIGYTLQASQCPEVVRNIINKLTTLTRYGTAPVHHSTYEFNLYLEEIPAPHVPPAHRDEHFVANFGNDKAFIHAINGADGPEFRFSSSAGVTWILIEYSRYGGSVATACAQREFYMGDTDCEAIYVVCIDRETLLTPPCSTPDDWAALSKRLAEQRPYDAKKVTSVFGSTCQALRSVICYSRHGVAPKTYTTRALSLFLMAMMELSRGLRPLPEVVQLLEHTALGDLISVTVAQADAVDAARSTNDDDDQLGAYLNIEDVATAISAFLAGNTFKTGMGYIDFHSLVDGIYYAKKYFNPAE